MVTGHHAAASAEAAGPCLRSLQPAAVVLLQSLFRMLVSLTAMKVDEDLLLLLPAHQEQNL